MIKIVLQEGRVVPVIVCDICHSRIDDVIQAVAVNTSMSEMKEGEPTECLHAHRRKCHDEAEAQFGPLAGWQDLSTHLYYLCYNLGLTPDWFQKRDKQYERFGM